MKTIEEIMGLVEKFGDACETFGDYQVHANALDCVKAKSAIESALRELVERKPLSEDRIIELQESHVGGVCPEYPLDGSDWCNFARAVEIEHGIGA